MVSSKPGTDLAVFDPSASNFPVLFSEETGGSFKELVEENFGDDGFSPKDLPVIKVPTGGSTFWNRGDDEPPIKEITGVITYWKSARTYWEKELDDPTREENTPPDCSSFDGKVGVGDHGPGSAANPSGACKTCPLSEYGTGKGSSQRCKESRQLWMIFEDSVLPTQVRLPAGSLGNFKAYMTKLAMKNQSYYSVITKLSLTPAKSSNGNAYAQAVLTKGEALAPEEAKAAKAYGQQIKATLVAADQARAAAVLAGESTDTGVEGNDPWAREDPLGGDEVPAGYDDPATV